MEDSALMEDATALVILEVYTVKVSLYSIEKTIVKHAKLNCVNPFD